MSNRQDTSVGVPEVLADLKRDLSELTQTPLVSSNSNATTAPLSNTSCNDLDILRTTVRRLEAKLQATEDRVTELEIQLSKLKCPGGGLAPNFGSKTLQANTDFRRSSSAAKIKHTMRMVGFLGQTSSNPPVKSLRPSELPSRSGPVTSVQHDPLPPIIDISSTVHRQVSHSAPPQSSFQDRVSAIKALVLNNGRQIPDTNADLE